MQTQHAAPPDIPALLASRGVRPTRQRVALAELLFSGADRHVTAEELHSEATLHGAGVSLATVYNTLHQLRATGLVHEVCVAPGRSYFDTNTRHHAHIFNEDTGELWDADASAADALVPDALPDGTALSRVDIVIRVHSAR